MFIEEIPIPCKHKTEADLRFAEPCGRRLADFYAVFVPYEATSAWGPGVGEMPLVL
jgi:hypothetical protein